MLKSRGYYRENDNQSNFRIDDRWLVVNCTGSIHFSMPFHTRSMAGRNDYYLLYVHCGELMVNFTYGDRVMRAGDFCLYSPHMPYYYGKDDAESDMVYLWAHFTGYGVEELLRLSGFDCGRVYSAGAESADGVAALFSGLFDSFILDGRERDVDAAGKLMQLFATLTRYVSGEKHNRRLKRSIEYISTHYPENISVPQLAEMENISCGRYNSVFRECFGMSPKEYITELRLRTAEDLLRRTDISVKEAAAVVGYDDQNYFSRLYAKKRGFTAKENKRQ